MIRIEDLFNRNQKPVKRGCKGPFVTGSGSVMFVMLHVTAALLPIIVWSVYVFGARVLTVICASVAATVASEALLTLAIYKKVRISDLTSVVTGLLLALTLPPATPLWLAAAGGVMAAVIKQISGGTGKNFLNPALFARSIIMLTASRFVFFTAPFEKLPAFASVDKSLTAPTAMSVLNSNAVKLPSESISELFFGRCAGNIGEISALLILICGGFLIARRIISYKIPVSFLLTVAAVTYLFPKIDVDSRYAVYSLLSGGVIFAAVFMATDHTTSPCTGAGQIIYGIGCGVLTVLLRYAGVFYDGAYPAVLIMNELARPIDALAIRLFYKKKKEKTVKIADNSKGNA